MDLLFWYCYFSSSIIFKPDNFDIILADDNSYNLSQVINGELARVNVDYNKTNQTYKNLVNYALIRKTIYLPTNVDYAG